jgi:peptidase M23-like protein
MDQGEEESRMELGRPDRMPRRRTGRRLLAIVVLLVVVAAAFAALRVGAAPRVEIAPELPGIGRRTPVVVRVAAGGRGLESVAVALVQGEKTHPLAEKRYTPRPFWAFWGPRTTQDEIRVEVGRETIEGLQAGEASIRVTASRAATPLRRPDPVVVEKTLPVRLQPPSLQVVSQQTYAAQGGSEAVVYRVGESAARDGVRVGELWFPGHRLPGGGVGDRFALFAVPYDVASATGVRLVAVDDVGNEATASFVEQFFPRPPGSDTIELTDAFLQKVVPEILAQTPDLPDRGGLLENYLQINGELRQRNAQELRDLAAKSRGEFLWREPFQPLGNAQVMSRFADRRTYVYQGKEVDHQVHLGFDLAVTRQVPVPASNRGVVVLARYFGIYGNTVVVDHGYGLQSLYAHLSSIGVRDGQEVERGQELGRSGETGLAGGDHLHFTILLQGQPVTPVEWWDPHWIQDRIARKLGGALPLQEKERGGVAAAPPGTS